VTSAGNDAGDACYKSPASAVSAITVGSTSYETNSDTVSWFSNYGTCLDIWAPGSDITSAGINPSNTAVAIMSGTSMVRAYERLRRHFHNPHPPSPRCADSGVDLHSIHTQACPLVAGVAAQYLEQNPTHTPATVTTALLNAATQMSTSEFYSRGSPREFLYNNFLPSGELFAITTASQCAEGLPYGPNTISNSDTSAYVSTVHKDTWHIQWQQVLDPGSGGTVVSITWDFTDGAKTVAQRFESAVVGGEAVTWTVSYGGSSQVLSGTWRFSSTAGSMLSRFEGQGTTFSLDDGLWGAGTGIVGGDGGARPADFWGHGNTNGADSLCTTVYQGSSSSTQSALMNRMYVLAIPPPSPPPSPPPPPYSPGEIPCDDGASVHEHECGTLWGGGSPPLPPAHTPRWNRFVEELSSLTRLHLADRHTPRPHCVAGEGLFVVNSGLCTVASDATCFRSPNYPSNYSNNQWCTITVAAHAQITLSVTAFDVEYHSTCAYDWLKVNGPLGQKYCGTYGPEGVQVAAGYPIYFASDYMATRSGFEICGALPPCRERNSS
jgi:hypothetical protein